MDTRIELTEKEVAQMSMARKTYAKNVNYLKQLNRQSITVKLDTDERLNLIMLYNELGAVAVEPATGLVRSVKRVKDTWVYNKPFGTRRVLNTSSPYIWCATKWGFVPTAHVLVAVATGKFDNKNPMIYEVGHLNPIHSDNRSANLEVITHGQNMDELAFRNLIKDNNISLFGQVLTHDKIQWVLKVSGGDVDDIQSIVAAAHLTGWSQYYTDRGVEDEQIADLETEVMGFKMPISRLSLMI